ncbi:MAG: hypothetical protein IJ623_08040 [Bacteroidales bacterium]|nr:hypothetical protein [Bacteroidales bacterium]
MKRKVIFAAISALMLSITAMGQTQMAPVKFKQEYSTRDIRADYGYLIDIDGNSGYPVLQVHYTQNFYGPLAFRAGAQMTPGSGVQQLGLPIALAYRPGIRSWGTSIAWAAEQSVYDSVWRGAYGNPESIGGSILTNFLLALFRRTEYFVGLTPAFSMEGYFAATADVGFVLSIPIWRLGLNITPAYHHVLTPGYFNSSDNAGSIFTITAGISFLFY